MSHADDEDGPIDRSLIEAARPGLAPSPADKARVRRAVLGAIAGGAVASGAAGAQAAAGGTALTGTVGSTTVAGVSLGAGIATKLAIGAITLASVVGVALVSTSGPTRPDAEVAEIHSPETARSSSGEDLIIPAFAPDVAPSAAAPSAADPSAAEVAPLAPEPTAPSEAAATRTRAPSVAPHAPADPVLDPMLDEARLLARAQEAIDRHDGRGAMTFLAEHARRFPDGQLREERFATRVHALCEMGETERARREATSFLDVFPVSVHAARVRASCAGPTTP